MSTSAVALQPINAITRSAVSSLGDLTTLGKMFAQSGFFSDASKEAQAVVKILAGAELGISPIAAMTGIYIVKGKISLGANLMAAKVKESKKYDYRVLELSAKRCEVEFLERRNDQFESIGKSEFTIEDAHKAGTQNLDKFGRNMLFARAMSNGCRWFCPDIFTAPIYTPDELGATVNDDGEVIDISPRSAPARTVESQPVDAVLMINAETQRAIEALWPEFGERKNSQVEPLADYLRRRKNVESLTEISQDSASKLLAVLQQRHLDAQSKSQTGAAPAHRSLAERVAEAEARLIQLGQDKAGIDVEWTAHAGEGVTLQTALPETVETWLEVLKQWASSLESHS